MNISDLSWLFIIIGVLALAMLGMEPISELPTRKK